MSSSTDSLVLLLDPIRNLCRQAGHRILEFYGGKGFATKQDSSPLTAADLASHSFLVPALEKLLPGVPVISEESSDGIADRVSEFSDFWLLDPLDGTKEFLKGTGEFTVNVALISARKPRLGVVHAPVLDLTYSGLVGVGAWRAALGELSHPITTRRADPGRLSVVASKDHAGPLVAAMLERMPGVVLQSMGSSLKFCLVAEGKADVYLRDLPTMEWDTAAAQCVVEAAGGAVLELSGLPLPYGKPGLKNPALMTVGDLQFDWKSRVGVESGVSLDQAKKTV